ncbi:MAG TPA: helix-turn-helix domain-containing protein [Thermomicrobiales bacterium]|nr:helix-turn-helix domain-containing protein [Thermomicrobiales bacterium]
MRGRPLVIEWKESADELRRRYEAERNGHRRARLHALWMLRQGHTIGEAGHVVGVDYRTIQRWVAWYRTNGIDDVLDRTPGHAAPGRPLRLDADALAALQVRAQRGDFRTIWDAVAWVQDTYGVTYTYTGMHALLHRTATRDATSK